MTDGRHHPLARLLSKLNSEGAEDAWRALIQQNSDNFAYYQGFFSNRGLALGTVIFFFAA
jgi:N-alpha-acetyltransferase 15/16, NatA auxiliary subunit